MANHSPRSTRRSDPKEAGARAASLVTAITLAVAFGGLALDVSWFWVAFPVGFGGVLPVAVARARRTAREGRRNRSTRHDAVVGVDHPGTDPGRDGGDDDPALATLRERYARGEIDEREFEARLETVLETE